MATQALVHMGVFGTINGRPPYKREFRAKAAETFYEGSPVELDSSGLLVASADDSTTVLGIAAEAVSSAEASQLVEVYVDDGNTLFYGNAYKTGDLSNSITQAADLYTCANGGGFELTVVSNKGHVDIAATTNSAIMVHGFYADYSAEDTLGDVYGKYIFTFQPSRQLPV